MHHSDLAGVWREIFPLGVLIGAPTVTYFAYEGSSRPHICGLDDRDRFA